MKKIISILFLFLLCYVCYYIYNETEDNTLDIVAIGDEVVYNPYKLSKCNYNYDFIDKDYRINDLLTTIKYNQEKTINDKSESIHQLLKKADVLIISIGMNDIYAKLNDNTKEIYTYMNNMLDDYEDMLKEIAKYDYKAVYILNYYNITNQHNDIFTYLNYKLAGLTEKYHYHCLDIAKLLNNQEEYYQKSDDFTLNNQGYRQIYNIFVEKIKKT